MVDDIDNVVDFQPWELPLLLLAGFRVILERAHERLAEVGHPDVRPAHGFTLQAVGEGASASEIAARLGVSKQAAGKTLAMLERQGYVTRTADRDDARQRTVALTDRGHDLLARSADAFAEVVSSWERTVGADAVAEVVATLRRLDLSGPTRLDLGAWAR